MRARWAFLAAGLSVILGATSAGASPAAVRAAGDSWARALGRGKAKAVAGHYERGSVLLGTFSQQSRETKPGMRAYFQGLSSKKGLRVKFAAGDQLTMLGDSHATRSGEYTFSFDGSKGREEVPARYTFVYGKNAAGQWKILSHHSSVQPGSE